MVNSEIGARMKQYENCYRFYLIPNSCVIVRLDGRDTQPWFGNNLQKIVSISASMATLFFNEEFRRLAGYEALQTYGTENETAHTKALTSRMACFDSRAFVIPREEVFNVIYWRQLDCTRNSIQLLGQANFSHKELQGFSCDAIQEKLFQEKGINWSNEPNWFKNGVSCYKVEKEIQPNVVRHKWFIDLNTPVFTTDRNYIEQHI